MKRLISLMPLCVVICLVCFSCENYTPRPKSYIYIDLPKKDYILFDSSAYPFSFELPSYSVFTPIKGNIWADIVFPSLGATINFTYISNPNLDSCIRNSLFFVDHNLEKANGMKETEISRPQDNVYGYVYDLLGPDVATTCQFYLTDSNKHFIRGALYLNCVPNNDSLAPVIDFLRADIERLFSTIRWK